MLRSCNKYAVMSCLISIALAANACAKTPLPPSPSPPSYNTEFWEHWSDGHAEIAAYDLTYDRYGQPRKGTAVAIFVTETFSDSLRVKADPGRHPEADEFPVIKLNLVQDFPTGIYDYNMMTSAFVALAPRHGRPAGVPTKISFSAQEWCGHAYHQVLFNQADIRHQLHSYFDGEADREGSIRDEGTAVSEDALLLWARGLAAPVVGPGESVGTRVLTSLATARLKHTSLQLHDARLSRSRDQETITLPSGVHTSYVMTAAIDGGPTWTFQVDANPPHRILKWTNTLGQSAQLIAADRFRYWQMNAVRYEQALVKLGLKPRPPRTP